MRRVRWRGRTCTQQRAVRLPERRQGCRQMDEGACESPTRQLRKRDSSLRPTAPVSHELQYDLIYVPVLSLEKQLRGRARWLTKSSGMRIGS